MVGVRKGREAGLHRVIGNLGIGILGALALTSGCGDGEDPGASGGTTDGDGTGLPSDATGASDESTQGTAGVDESSSSGSEGPGEVSVSCDDLPLGAIGATYAFSPTADGFAGAVDWTVSGLPAGLSSSPLDGALSGTPTEAGEFEITFEAADEQSSAMATCVLTVAEALTVDLAALAGPCVGIDDDVLSLLDGGDGSPVQCSTPVGQGNGSLPEGVEVDAETCAITGDPDDTYGTWVWMTFVQQSGYGVWVPYCVTEEDQAPDAVAITATHAAGDVLDPAEGTFGVDEPLHFGALDDPRFEIRGGCAPDFCEYGFVFGLGPSPFDEFGLSPSQSVSGDEGLEGFSHQMWADGETVPEALADRIWVASWRMTYCTTDVDGTCEGNANIQANSNGELRFGVIMRPQ